MDYELTPEEQRRIKIKRFFIYVFTIFTLVIVVLYMLMANDFHDILAGLLVSTTITNDFKMEYKDYTITFAKDVYKNLKNLYFANARNEFKACLSGTVKDNNYLITSLEVPLIYSQSVFHITSSTCKEGTLIDLHSHPYKHCVFSQQDIVSYDLIKKSNPDILLALMCEPDRFTFYRD